MAADPLDVCLRLVRVQAAVARRFDNELGAVHGVSLNDLAILLNLDGARGGRMRRVDLAVRMLLSQSGVTRALAPLERLGLVAREADPRDARVGYARRGPPPSGSAGRPSPSAGSSARSTRSPTS